MAAAESVVYDLNLASDLFCAPEVLGLLLALVLG
jgi:hypothetical protein